MIINKALYNYHGIVSHLASGVSPEHNLKYTIIKAYGQCEVIDETRPTGRRLKKQDMTAYAHSGLSCYVDAEISVGDKVLIVGKIITKSIKKGGVWRLEQCIEAEEVYKNEWAKYYKGEQV